MIEIILYEGEKIKISAGSGTSEAYMIVECFQKCILKESEVRVIKEEK